MFSSTNASISEYFLPDNSITASSTETRFSDGNEKNRFINSLTKSTELKSDSPFIWDTREIIEFFWSGVNLSRIFGFCSAETINEALPSNRSLSRNRITAIAPMTSAPSTSRIDTENGLFSAPTLNPPNRAIIS